MFSGTLTFSDAVDIYQTAETILSMNEYRQKINPRNNQVEEDLWNALIQFVVRLPAPKFFEEIESIESHCERIRQTAQEFLGYNILSLSVNRIGIELRTKLGIKPDDVMRNQVQVSENMFQTRYYLNIDAQRLFSPHHKVCQCVLLLNIIAESTSDFTDMYVLQRTFSSTFNQLKSQMQVADFHNLSLDDWLSAMNKPSTRQKTLPISVANTWEHLSVIEKTDFAFSAQFVIQQCLPVHWTREIAALQPSQVHDRFKTYRFFLHVRPWNGFLFNTDFDQRYKSMLVRSFMQTYAYGNVFDEEKKIPLSDESEKHWQMFFMLVLRHDAERYAVHVMNIWRSFVENSKWIVSYLQKRRSLSSQAASLFSLPQPITEPVLVDIFKHKRQAGSNSMQFPVLSESALFSLLEYSFFLAELYRELLKLSNQSMNPTIVTDVYRATENDWNQLLTKLFYWRTYKPKQVLTESELETDADSKIPALVQCLDEKTCSIGIQSLEVTSSNLVFTSLSPHADKKEELWNNLEVRRKMWHLAEANRMFAFFRYPFSSPGFGTLQSLSESEMIVQTNTQQFLNTFANQQYSNQGYGEYKVLEKKDWQSEDGWFSGTPWYLLIDYVTPSRQRPKTGAVAAAYRTQGYVDNWTAILTQKKTFPQDMTGFLRGPDTYLKNENNFEVPRQVNADSIFYYSRYALWKQIQYLRAKLASLSLVPVLQPIIDTKVLDEKFQFAFVMRETLARVQQYQQKLQYELKKVGEFEGKDNPYQFAQKRLGGENSSYLQENKVSGSAMSNDTFVVHAWLFRTVEQVLSNLTDANKKWIEAHTVNYINPFNKKGRTGTYFAGKDLFAKMMQLCMRLPKASANAEWTEIQSVCESLRDKVEIAASESKDVDVTLEQVPQRLKEFGFDVMDLPREEKNAPKTVAEFKNEYGTKWKFFFTVSSNPCVNVLVDSVLQQNVTQIGANKLFGLGNALIKKKSDTRTNLLSSFLELQYTLNTDKINIQTLIAAKTKQPVSLESALQSAIEELFKDTSYQEMDVLQQFAFFKAYRFFIHVCPWRGQEEDLSDEEYDLLTNFEEKFTKQHALEEVDAKDPLTNKNIWKRLFFAMARRDLERYALRVQTIWNNYFANRKTIHQTIQKSLSEEEKKAKSPLWSLEDEKNAPQTIDIFQHRRFGGKQMTVLSLYTLLEYGLYLAEMYRKLGGTEVYTATEKKFVDLLNEKFGGMLALFTGPTIVEKKQWDQDTETKIDDFLAINDGTEQKKQKAVWFPNSFVISIVTQDSRYTPSVKKAMWYAASANKFFAEITGGNSASIPGFGPLQEIYENRRYDFLEENLSRILNEQSNYLYDSEENKGYIQFSIKAKSQKTGWEHLLDFVNQSNSPNRFSLPHTGPIDDNNERVTGFVEFWKSLVFEDQTFRNDYRWYGRTTAKFGKVSNAVFDKNTIKYYARYAVWKRIQTLLQILKKSSQITVLKPFFSTPAIQNRLLWFSDNELNYVRLYLSDKPNEELANSNEEKMEKPFDTFRDEEQVLETIAESLVIYQDNILQKQPKQGGKRMKQQKLTRKGGAGEPLITEEILMKLENNNDAIKQQLSNLDQKSSAPVEVSPELKKIQTDLEKKVAIGTVGGLIDYWNRNVDQKFFYDRRPLIAEFTNFLKKNNIPNVATITSWNQAKKTAREKLLQSIDEFLTTQATRKREALELKGNTDAKKAGLEQLRVQEEKAKAENDRKIKQLQEQKKVLEQRKEELKKEQEKAKEKEELKAQEEKEKLNAQEEKEKLKKAQEEKEKLNAQEEKEKLKKAQEEKEKLKKAQEEKEKLKKEQEIRELQEREKKVAAQLEKENKELLEKQQEELTRKVKLESEKRQLAEIARQNKEAQDTLRVQKEKLEKERQDKINEEEKRKLAEQERNTREEQENVRRELKLQAAEQKRQVDKRKKLEQQKEAFASSINPFDVDNATATFQSSLFRGLYDQLKSNQISLEEAKTELMRQYGEKKIQEPLFPQDLQYWKLWDDEYRQKIELSIDMPPPLENPSPVPWIKTKEEKKSEEKNKNVVKKEISSSATKKEPKMKAAKNENDTDATKNEPDTEAAKKRIAQMQFVFEEDKDASGLVTYKLVVGYDNSKDTASVKKDAVRLGGGLHNHIRTDLSFEEIFQDDALSFGKADADQKTKTMSEADADQKTKTMSKEEFWQIFAISNQSSLLTRYNARRKYIGEMKQKLKDEQEYGTVVDLRPVHFPIFKHSDVNNAELMLYNNCINPKFLDSKLIRANSALIAYQNALFTTLSVLGKSPSKDDKIYKLEEYVIKSMVNGGVTKDNLLLLQRHFGKVEEGVIDPIIRYFIKNTNPSMFGIKFTSDKKVESIFKGIPIEATRYWSLEVLKKLFGDQVTVYEQSLRTLLKTQPAYDVSLRELENAVQNELTDLLVTQYLVKDVQSLANGQLMTMPQFQFLQQYEKASTQLFKTLNVLFVAEKLNEYHVPKFAAQFVKNHASAETKKTINKITERAIALYNKETKEVDDQYKEFSLVPAGRTKKNDVTLPDFTVTDKMKVDAASQIINPDAESKEVADEPIRSSWVPPKLRSNPNTRAGGTFFDEKTTLPAPLPWVTAKLNSMTLKQGGASSAPISSQTKAKSATVAKKSTTEAPKPSGVVTRSMAKRSSPSSL